MKNVCLTILLLLFFATAAFAEVNINKANAKELEALPGIGKEKAEAIIDYRSKNGAFNTIEELTGVKGIGPKILKKIKPECTL